MNRCKKIQKKLALFLYNELDESSKTEVQAHLESCKKCSQALAEMQRMLRSIPQKRKITNSELERQRIIAMSRLRRTAQKRHASRILSLKPAAQLAFAASLLCIGFFMGKLNPFFHGGAQSVVQRFLSTDQVVRSHGSEIRPVMLSVRDVSIHEDDRTVDIRYNMVHSIRTQGNIQQPEIQDILCNAMLENKNPAVRLHAVKALRLIAGDEKEANEKVLASIQQLLIQEQNEGIKLMALRVLNSMPSTAKIQDMLIDELLYNDNTAIRIEAFQGLAVGRNIQPQILSVLRSIESDSIGYFRHKAKQILQNSQKREELL